jgi:CubicO group peptidase (beta-lactamase class C family)
MQRFLRLLCPLALAAFCHAKPPADLQAKLDAYTHEQSGGAALAWVDADGEAFFFSGQLSSKDTRHPGPDTQFELGSISKVFTALLLAESERLGRVSRSDPAAKFLLPAEDPAQAALAKITLLSLTTHSSGLPRLPANLGPNPDGNPDPYANYDRAALLEGLKLHGPGSPVGRAVAYSNFGVAVLGDALAAAWQQPYPELLQKRILAPLQLTATSIGLAGTPAPAELAPGHGDGGAVPNWTWRAFAPAGGLRSNVNDMARFLSEWLNFKESPLRVSMDATLQPQRSADDAGGMIGLGWFLFDQPDHSVAWHNGATAGCQSFLAFDRKTRIGVVILANISRPSKELGFGLLGVKPPTPSLGRAKDPEAYLGRYPLNPNFALDITTDKGVLFLQATGQPRLVLSETSPDHFAVKGVPAEVSFVRDENKRIVSLVLHQNGAEMPGPRQALPAPPVAIEVPVETLRDYVGSYPLAPSFVLTVTEENGALFVQATGQGKFPVFAKAKDEFFYKVVNAQLSFERDTTGKVIKVILHQGGRNLPGNKAGD